MDAARRDAWLNIGLALDRTGGIALDIEPPGAISDAWRHVLKQYGVAELNEDARFAEAQKQKQTKGAPLTEVAAVFGAICGSAVELCAGACERYRALSIERPKKMFAHAMAAAKQHRYDEYAPGAYVLRCPSCGAPRLKAKLECDFCGAAIK